MKVYPTLAESGVQLHDILQGMAQIPAKHKGFSVIPVAGYFETLSHSKGQEPWEVDGS